MIILYHHKNKVSRITGANDLLFLEVKKQTIAQALMYLAIVFPEKKIVWCSEKLANNLNLEKIESLFHHNKMMLSYSESTTFSLQKGIGYVEQSPFIKINQLLKYPTWLMSTSVGVIHASVLNVFSGQIKPEADFDYFLNSIAKLGMPNGLFCYSEPELLVQQERETNNKQSNVFTLFRFVKQHYKKRWLLLLFINLVVFEKRFPVLPLLFTFFYKSRINASVNLDSVTVKSSALEKYQPTIDVIIPTIGRKKYLYDVLKDLANQSVLPINVIIVEQNPKPNSVSALDYLSTEHWPFQIKHTFTHQAGACNARNIALDQVTSDWVFLGDDDNRFNSKLIEEMFDKAQQYGTTVVTTNYILKEEIQEYNIIHQSGIFGSGNSFVKTASLKTVRFDKALEFGYGEDTDFGMQLRNHGHDVVYFPTLKILHLKAPMGGFRTPIVKKWDTEEIQPKPSPTIMYVYKKHFTSEQQRGYKIVLFLKLIKKESVRKYIDFYINFKLKWNASVYWANQLPS